MFNAAEFAKILPQKDSNELFSILAQPNNWLPEVVECARAELLRRSFTPEQIAQNIGTFRKSKKPGAGITSLKVILWASLALNILLITWILHPHFRKDTPQSYRIQDSAVIPGDAVSLLCHHIAQSRQKMIVDTNWTQLIWSDGAIFEMGTNFPALLQKLISKPTRYQDLWPFYRSLDSQRRAEYREGLVQTAPDYRDRYVRIISKDGGVSASVEFLYVDYLNLRYPDASIWIKGEFDPIIFVVAGQLRAAVMPIKL